MTNSNRGRGRHRGRAVPTTPFHDRSSSLGDAFAGAAFFLILILLAFAAENVETLFR